MRVSTGAAQGAGARAQRTMPSELSVSEFASAMKEENTSGSEEPAAMSVAPLTSSDSPNFSPSAAREATK